jgi:integrase
MIKLLSAAGDSAHPARDKAIIAVMMGMGLRRLEVANLNVEDVVIEADHSGYAHIHGKRTKANKTGERDAAFDAATGRILVAYLDQSDVQSGPLFRNPQGERLSTQGVYRATKSLIRAAGIESEVQACHDLRRAFATYSARHRRGTDNADRRRRQLGHSKFSQTAEYELLDVEDLRVDFISPLGVMSEGVLGIDPY